MPRKSAGIDRPDGPVIVTVEGKRVNGDVRRAGDWKRGHVSRIEARSESDGQANGP